MDERRPTHAGPALDSPRNLVLTTGQQGCLCLVARKPLQAFSVLICLSSRPETKRSDHPEWLDSAAVLRWLCQNSSDCADVRPADSVSPTRVLPSPAPAVR